MAPRSREIPDQANRARNTAAAGAALLTVAFAMVMVAPAVAPLMGGAGVILVRGALTQIARSDDAAVSVAELTDRTDAAHQERAAGAAIALQPLGASGAAVSPESDERAADGSIGIASVIAATRSICTPPPAS